MIKLRNFLLGMTLSLVTLAPSAYAQSESIYVSAHITPESGQEALAECQTEMFGLRTQVNYPNVRTTCHVDQSGSELLPSVSCAGNPNAVCSKMFPTTQGLTYVARGDHNIDINFVFACDFNGGAYIDVLGYVPFSLPNYLENQTIFSPGETDTCLRPLLPILSFRTFPVALTHSNSFTFITISPTTANKGPGQTQVFTASQSVNWSVSGDGTVTPTTGTSTTYTAPSTIESQHDVTVNACTQTPGDCATATITLYPLTVTVTPSSAAVLPAKPLQLKAAVTGPPNVDQTVTWSFAPGSPQVGNIDKTTGIYSTPLQVTTPATVIIKATSNLDTMGMSFGTATLSIGPVSITVSGPTDFLATPGAQQPYTASVISPGNTDVIWTAIAPATSGTITPLSSSSAQYTAPSTPTLPGVTPIKIQACLAADNSFCGDLSVTLSPQVIISAAVTPNAWPSGQQTAVTIAGSGFGSTPPNVRVSDPLVNFSLTGFTNAQIQGTVNPPLIPSTEPVTLTVTSTSNPITSSATSGVITVNPPTITTTLFPTAATLLETQQQTFTATVGCKLANGSSCQVPQGVTCSLNNPSTGMVTAGGTTCTYTATATVTGQPGLVQLIAKSVFSPNSPPGVATITLTPLNVTLTPLTVSLGGGQTQKFTQAVTGALNNNNGVNWSLAKIQQSDPVPVGNIDQTGLYTAPNPIGTTQTFFVKACSQIDLVVCGQAQITLTPFSVTVSPGAVSLTSGATQQFSSTTLGASNTAVTWIITPSVGTISPIGLYTAPLSIPTAQTVTVKACSVITPAPPNPCGTAVVNLLAVSDFSVSATPTSQTVSPGGSTVYNVTATSIAGFTGTVNFNCPVTPLTTGVTLSGCPVSISLASSPVSFPVTVTTVSSTTPQNYTITVTGTAGLLNHSSALTLSVAGGPVPVFSTTALTFSDQLVGTTSPSQSVTLSNTGTASLIISGKSVSTDFVQTNDCPSSLAVNAICTFTVSFTPTFRGPHPNSALTIIDNAAGSPHEVTLTGFGTSIDLSPSLIFPGQIVGAPSPAQAVTLTNNTTAPLVFTGSNIFASSDFSATNNCGPSLAVSASCTINVTFTPLATGVRPGTLFVNDNAPNSPQTISLSGTGLPLVPVLTGITPSTVTTGSSGFTLIVTGSSFASNAVVQVNGSARQTRFINLLQLQATIPASDLTGSQPLNITVLNPAPSGAVSTALPLTLTSSPIPLISNLTPPRVIECDPALSPTPCPSFKLIVNGSFFSSGAQVQIDGVSRATTFINANQLTATILPADLIISRFASIKVVGPTGGFSANAAPLAVFRYGDLTFDNVVSIADLNSLANFLAGNNTPADPAPGDVLLDGKINISDLNILANFLAGNIHTLPVIPDQTAILFNAGAPVNLSPPTFAGQMVGTTSEPLSLKLTNGPTPLSISVNVTPIGEFIQTNDCGLSLTANASCTINVTFSPTGAGSRTATLTVTNNAGNSPQTANLSGTGIGSAAAPTAPTAAPTAALSSSLGITDGPVTLAFPIQTMGTNSALQRLRLINTGSTALSISGINIAPSGEFTESDNCGTSLAAGTSCNINVTFSPAASGTRTATLTVTDNASNSPQTANLTGTGAP